MTTFEDTRQGDREGSRPIPKHTVLAICLVSLIVGMVIGCFFVNSDTVAICRELSTTRSGL